MRVLIVGGGMAGLATAIALGRDGHAVTVVELTGRVEGAVIAITNRAVDALEALGVLDAVTPLSFVIAGAESIFSFVRDGNSGDPLPVPPPPPRADTRLPSAVSLLRPQFMAILGDAARAAEADVRIGRTVTALDERGDTVVATYDDGTAADFDLVIGADGVRSVVRSLVFPDAPAPVYTGHMSFRWVVADGPPGPTGLYVLPSQDGMMMTTRLPGNLVYLASGVQMERRYVAPEEARALLRTQLERYGAPLMQGLRARLDDAQEVVIRPYNRLLLPPPWYRGRVLLVGDAAHATTAHLASGGSLALEDAVVLAEEVAKAADVPAALDAYQARREVRVRMVVDAGSELSRLQREGAPPAVSAKLRAEAVAALRQPY